MKGSGGKKRILIADDSEDTREILSLALTRAGYSVKTVSSGRELLEKWSGDIDLVIVDIVMPEMGGIEAVETARSEGKDPKPVIFISAKDRLETYLKYSFKNTVRFLPKPFRAETLLNMTREVLGE